jgi:hypothetical protein
MTTTYEYELHQRFTGVNSYCIGRFTDIEQAKAAAKQQENYEAAEFAIYEKKTSTTCVEVISVPASIPDAEDVINEIIDNTIGSREIYYPESFQQLSEGEQARVKDAVCESLDCCDHCGDYVEAGDIYHTDFGSVCDSCEQHLMAEEEERIREEEEQHEN